MTLRHFFGAYSLAPSERLDIKDDRPDPGLIGADSLGPHWLDPAERLQRIRALLERHASLIRRRKDRETLIRFIAYVDDAREALQAVDLLEDQLGDPFREQIKTLRKLIAPYAR